MRKIILIAILGCVLDLLSAGSVWAVPNIGTITKVTTGDIGRYLKFEIAFSITNGSYTNPYYPYDASPPAGVPAGAGISVNAWFKKSTQAWEQAKIIPCFYYQPMVEVGSGSGVSFFPEGAAHWRCRFAPETEAIWQYKVRATDSSGTAETETAQFTSVASNSKGFVRVSGSDSRFFEFANGEPFVVPLVNLEQGAPFSRLSQIRSNVQNMGQNGMRFVRWFPTGEGANAEVALFADDIRINWRFGDGQGDKSDSPDPAAGKLFSYAPYYYSIQDAAVKPGYNYRLKFRAKITGNQVLRASAGIGSSIDICSAANTNHSGCTYKRDGWNDYSISGLNSGSGSLTVALQGLYVSNDAPSPYNNVQPGTVRVNSTIFQRDETGSGSWGGNILTRSDPETQTYVDQPAAARLDEILRLSEQLGVYHKLTLFHKNDHILDQFQPNGSVLVDRWDPMNFYVSPAVSWYVDAFTRYFVARWSYSTALHSLELANENDPGSSTMIIRIAKEINGVGIGGDAAFAGRQVLMSNSYWHWIGLPVSAWTDPSMHFADRHWYATGSGGGPDDIYSNQTRDAVAYVRDCRTFFRNYNQANNINKPFVQGESGNGVYQSAVESDSTGTWYHKQLWTHVGVLGYTCGGEWWPNYAAMYPSYKSYDLFLRGESLANGRYSEIGTDLAGNAQITTSNSTLRAFGSKDTGSAKVLVWVDNKNNTFQNPNNNTAASGNLTITGMPQGSYTRETWDTRAGTFTTTTNAVTVGSNGSLVFSVSTAKDIAYKFYLPGVVSPTPSPSIAPQVCKADIDSNGLVNSADLRLVLRLFAQTVSGQAEDINNDGKVNGLDLVRVVKDWGSCQ